MRLFGGSPDYEHPLYQLYARVLKALKSIYRLGDGLDEAVKVAKRYQYEKSLVSDIERPQKAGYEGGFRDAGENSTRVSYKELLPPQAKILALRFAHPTGKFNGAIPVALASVNWFYLMQI